MSPTSAAILSPNKKIVNLFEISYGSTFLRMNNSQDPLSLAIGDFASVPSLKLIVPKYTGIFERSLYEADFDYKPYLLFARAITSGRAFAECYCRAWQWVRDEGSDRLGLLFASRVASATLNPGGKEGILRISTVTPKAETRRNSGIVLANQCQWTFGDPKTCTVDLPSKTEAGQITVISNNVVTITGLSAHPFNYWTKGRVEADGVSLNIRNWLGGTSFILGKTPPLDWEDSITGFGFKNVSVIPGCDKLLTTCRFTWNNEINFEGLGIAVPAYNPLFEGS